MEKVLIIDDDEALLLILQTELKAAGFTVYATADGPDGIRLFKENRADLVLLDLGLPSLDGIEVLKALRRIDGNAKVIIVSGYSSGRFKNEALQSGAIGFVEKPVNMDFLFELIHSAVRRA